MAKDLEDIIEQALVHYDIKDIIKYIGVDEVLGEIDNDDLIGKLKNCFLDSSQQDDLYQILEDENYDFPEGDCDDCDSEDDEHNDFAFIKVNNLQDHYKVEVLIQLMNKYSEGELRNML